ncbi:MAG: hypothetical protein WCP06_01055 [Verrucomicrobiota bacterium]
MIPENEQPPINPGPESQFEKRDMDAPGVGLVAAMLILFLILSSIATALWYQSLSVRTQREMGPVLEPMPGAEAQFPKPQLQANPPLDLAKLRQQEDAVLNGYRWIDQKTGIVGVPIAEAMELLVRRGDQPVLGTPGLPQGPTWPEMMQRRAQEATGVPGGGGKL